ncbi:MAG TPA: NUDIX hydrolase [Solirubrobacteraceae bacterium]|nr:NUDIX hydrolase [Solirubrobacteraceae bacterium]
MSASDRRFEPRGGRTEFEGNLFEVRVERFQFPDGDEVQREIVRHGGAVGIVAHDGQHVWLVRQPREAIGDPDLLEIPAGRLDVDGEQPLQAAQRELAEEIGRRAEHWELLTTYYSSAGFTDEQVHVYLATDLSEASADSEENERIEIVPWPLAELDRAIESCQDAKTLIGLLLLARRGG